MTLNLSGLDRFKASALLRDDDGSVSGVPLEMELDLIDFDPGQPRRSMSDKALAELAESIRAKKVLEPVSLRTNPDCPGRYIVNRGERRVRASRLAGRTTVPYFLDEDADPYAQVVENLQREDLTPFDLSYFIAERERCGDSRAEIARKLGKPASFITEAAGLVDAPAAVRAAFDDGRARDTRVLYQLTRGLRENAPVVEPLLDGKDPLTRSVLDRVVRPQPSLPLGGEGSDSRRIEGTRVARAMVVEHGGRRGHLGLNGQPGKRTASVNFDDGSRQVVDLAELKLIAWTAR